jgi:predicted permease
MPALFQDAAYAFRQLRRSPGFAVTAALSLALGIGANTAIFQLVNAIRLKFLPVRNPHELVLIDFEKGSMRSGNFSTRSANLTYAQYDAIRTQRQAFTGVLAWSAHRFNLAPGGEARYAEGLYVSGNFFSLLGVNPLLGRTFTEQDDTAACSNPGAVLSYDFWQREFDGDTAALGRAVLLDGHDFPVIGVTPRAFFGVEVGYRYDVAIPLCADRMLSDDGKGRIPVRHYWWLSLMGRLKPGWTAARATSYLHTISPAIMQATLPPVYRARGTALYLKNKLGATPAATGESDLRSQYEQPLWLLMATTGLVLLIACANLANLLLARAGIRQREFAVRLAIGASRWRLIRQLLAESLLLAAIGGALGAGLAQLLSRGLLSFLNTADNPVFLELGWDWHTLGFTAALALVTCILFGLTPAFRATRIAPAAAMRAGGRSVTSGKERFSLRRILVTTQVALSLVLLVGALLFVRSLRSLMTTELGFQPEGVLSLDVDYSRSPYPKERRLPLDRELQDRLAALPGVVSAAQVMMTPVSGNGWNDEVGPDGATANASGKISNFNAVGPGYFHTMETRLVAGREFTDRDTASSPKVAIVNQVFARKFLGGANPVGRTFHLEAPAGQPEPLFQIVGLVRNTKYYKLREDFVPIGYVPFAQNPDPSPEAVYVLRVRGSPGAVMKAAKAAMGQVDSSMTLTFRSLSAQLDDSLLRERLVATLSGAFGLLAELLATLGLYGVISYMVGRRQSEIGVRMALGADRANVIGLVLRETILLVAIGLAVGTGIVLWAGRAAAPLLFGLKPYDPVTLIAAVALLTLVAVAASYFPARRAAALDPMLALRDE